MATPDEVKKSQKATTGGRKFDGGKLQYGLLPPLALAETVKVLTFGAEKYEPDNWKQVPDSKRRYFDALQRHRMLNPSLSPIQQWKPCFLFHHEVLSLERPHV